MQSPADHESGKAVGGRQGGWEAPWEMYLMTTRTPSGMHLPLLVGVPELGSEVFSTEALPCDRQKQNLPEIDPSVYAYLIMIKKIIIKWGKSQLGQLVNHS